LKQIEIEKEISRRLARVSLYHFTKYFWKLIEPETPFVDGWHIKAICDHLEAVARFDIQKLIINIPPRHMKSILGCVAFPAWVWVDQPDKSFIYGSHSATLATRDSIKTRQIIESQLYRETFNIDWKLLGDQNLKTSFKNSRGGTRHSVGVGSGITGFGGDFLFIDDPTSALDAHSELARDEAIRWNDTVLSTRINNPKKYAKVLIMQRLHENDLTGHLIKTNNYDRLILPAEFDPDADDESKSKTALNFIDPRQKKGELLWPNQWDEKAIEDAKITLGQDAEAQLNQTPKPPKGGLFPIEDWRFYEASPSSILETGLFIDAAQKPGVSNDYSVFAVWARTENAYFLLDLWQQKTDAPTLEALTLSYSEKWRPNAVVIEDKSAGSSLIQYLLYKTSLPVLPFDPGQRDKVVRATAATPTVRAGKCYLPKAPIMIQDDESRKTVNLIDLFVKQHNKFPKTKHDDMVDTTSMMIEFFSKRSLSGPRIRSII
jgi:predicted phage terminase large subunit-like protein